MKYSVKLSHAVHILVFIYLSEGLPLSSDKLARRKYYLAVNYNITALKWRMNNEYIRKSCYADTDELFKILRNVYGRKIAL